jgi:hypothetical protein
MCIKNLFPSLVMFFLAAASSAAEPETKPQTTAPDQVAAAIRAMSAEPVIPKRELKFDVSEDELPLPLENMREGMLDQRFVATFRLVLPKTEKSAESSPDGRPRMTGMYEMSSYKYLNSNLTRDTDNRNFIEHLSIFENFRRVLLSETNRTSFSVVSNFFSRVNASHTEEYQLSKDIMASIVWENPPFIEIENNFRSNTTGNANYIEVRFLAPTDKQARQCVEKWLAIYDDGLCYHAQKDCINLKKKLIEMLAENSDKLKNAEADLGNAKQEAEKYKDFADITRETLVTLKTQRRMLAVDLAGINARIKACQEMLAKGNMPDARKDQIETARVAAEIELRGLDAKQTEIDRIIQGAQNRQKFDQNLTFTPQNIRQLKDSINNIQKAIPELEQYQLGYQPLSVDDGKVTIRRIKWISPPKTEKSKSDSTSAPK